jgi:hypothetical protein
VSLRVDEGLWRRVKACASRMGVPVETWVGLSWTGAVERQETATANGVDVAWVSGGRRPGRSKLHGRPLDEDGKIALRVERTTDPLHGIPEAIGTSEDFPLTSRTGEYMGISGETVPGKDSAGCGRCGHPAAAHREFTGRCEWGAGCEKLCRSYQAPKIGAAE